MAIITPGQDVSNTSDPADKKVKLNSFESEYLKEFRANKDILVLAYGEGCRTYDPSTNRDDFMEFILEYLTGHFGWDKGRITHREAMCDRIYPSLFATTIDDKTGRPYGIIPLLSTYMEQKPRKGGVKASDMEESSSSIARMAEILERLKDKSSPEWKKHLATATANRGDSHRTPEVIAEMQINVAKEKLTKLKENYSLKAALIKAAAIAPNGAYYKPERASKNLAVKIAKQYDDTLGAGGIDFSQFEL